jgi:hypothetical protein
LNAQMANMQIDPENVFRLIATPSPPELGPERRPGTEKLEPLNRKIDSVLGQGSMNERSELVRALVLLWHDHLNEAHELAQGVDGPDGAFVHGIMHRREPDYGNAAYWFRRVGKHPAFGEIRSRIARMPQLSSFEEVERTLLPRGSYDPFGFINVCEGYVRRPESERDLLREVQAIETRVLIGRFVGNSG